MSPPIDPPTHITLRIKVPPGHIPQQETHSLPAPIAVNTTVGHLREWIHTHIPTNPPPERQRLLFAGRALVDNDQTLADALCIRRDPEQTEYVVHLLVRGDYINTPPRPSSLPPPLPSPVPPPPSQQQPPDTLPQAALPRTHPHPHPHPHPPPPHHHHLPPPPLPQGPARTQNFFVQGVGPNGERISLHHQQHFIQHPAPNGLPHLPPAVHGLPPPVFGIQPFGLHYPPTYRPASPPRDRDRARQQLAEMRRLLDEVRQEGVHEQYWTPTNVARIARIEQHLREINNYVGQPNHVPIPSMNQNVLNPNVHPNLHPNLHPHLQATAGNNPSRNDPSRNNPSRNDPSTRVTPPSNRVPSLRVPAPTNPQDVTCYLLSDPTGAPQALLMTPRHGTYTGTLSNNIRPQQSIHVPTPAAPMMEPARLVQAQAVPPRQAPAVNVNAAAAAPVNPVEVMIRHFWMMVRIAIFGYFFLGSNLGWRRPLALGLMALGFWLVNAGIMGNGGMIRAWWDDMVRGGAAAVEPVRNPGNAGAMPTPEELARRLLEERRRGENEWIRWGRERLRALVLLLASLWPGVGEALVRAREAEERRLAEEEVAEGRRREEERAREAEEKRLAEDEEKNRVESEGKGEASASANGEQSEGKNRVDGGEQTVMDEPTGTGEKASATDGQSC